MLSNRRFPDPHPSSLPTGPKQETKAMWATTATGDLDSAAAANDEVGSLGFHARACKLGNGGIRRGVDTLSAIGSFLRSRLISVVVVLTLAATAAVWILG